MQNNIKSFEIDKSISFLYTTEEFGGLSNLSKEYPIYLKKVYINSSEALYQAMKYTDYPEIQKKIINSRTPKDSKIESQKYKELIREDWDSIRTDVMFWCLKIKLLNNWINFGKLLHKTKNYNIVEISYRDEFWGAIPKEKIYYGYNMLGILLMKLREEYRSNKLEDYIVEPPNIKNFKLYDCFATTLILKKDKKISLLNEYKLKKQNENKYIKQKLF